MPWKVFLSVPVQSMQEWDKVNKIVDKIDTHWDGAGTGFGCREFDWTKKTESQAENLAKRLRTALEAECFEADISTDEKEEDEDDEG